MELYFAFMQCKECDTTWVHIYEEEKRMKDQRGVSVYFYHTCLQCSVFDHGKAMEYLKTPVEQWDDFRLPICN